MKHIPWKYLAGLVDGEGCIDVQVTNMQQGQYCSVRPRLRICMSVVAKEVIDLLHNNFGGYIQERKFDNVEWSDALSWELPGYKQVCPVLRNIVNHLIIKKQQVRFCLWMETNLKGKHVSTDVRDAIREELKLMKRDPHRLSEKAQERILNLLGCDSRNT